MVSENRFLKLPCIQVFSLSSRSSRFARVLLWKICIIFCELISGLIKRCYQCRSRGDLGSCKDTFRYNASSTEVFPGISAVPCASGWCGKVIEGETGAFREDGELKFAPCKILCLQFCSFEDFDTATQRMCVQRGPDDNEDRCAHTTYNGKKVFMCFCQGDLCNAATSRHYHTHYVLLLLATLTAIKLLR